MKALNWAGRLVSAAALLLRPRPMAMAGAALLAAGCQVIPKSDAPVAPPPPPVVTEPSATALPTDSGRHRIALLVPTSGETAAVGQAIANATTMALLDTNADNLRITSYDTSAGAAAAAAQAIADGNKLILGPLAGEDVTQVAAAARAAGVPVIAFTNDTRLASSEVFVMAGTPEQSIRRSVQYLRKQGTARFAALAPEGDYGARALAALDRAIAEFGGTLVRRETYARGNTSVVSAAARLRAGGGFDAVLIADSARLGLEAAGELQRGRAAKPRLIGTELWSGDPVLARAPAMQGALFSAVSDQRYKRFADSYETRFGAKPYRIATLGYDAVLLTLRIAREWKVGSAFPKNELYDRGGFLGVDGPFRFTRAGIAERALEVREVKGQDVIAADPAPTGFGG